MGKTMEFAINLSLLMGGNFTGAVSPAIQRISELDQKIRSLSKTAAGTQKMQAMKTSLEGLREKLNAAQMRVKTLRTEMSQAEHPSKRMRQEFTKANIDAAKLKEAVQKQMKSIADLGKSLREAGVDTSKLGSEQDRLRSSIDRVKAAQDKLNSARSRYAQLRERLDWGNIKNDVMMILGTFSALKTPVKLAADFESAMARVKAVSFSTEGADLTLFEQMKAQAAQLGADTQFTAIQAAKGQENLLRANLSPREVMAAMPGLLNMASAEGMDLDTASTIIAKGLGGMGLEGKYAGRLADILAYTSASSNTDIANIGEAFKVVAPVFSPLGASMEQISSYIGVMANKGYEGSQAGNALASSVMRLSSLPKKAADMLKGIGLDPRMFRTKSGKMVELPEIMKMLDRAMKRKNLGDSERLAIVKEVFGTNQGKAMNAFLEATVAGMADTMQAGVQNNSFGQAQRMTNINLDTLNGQLQILGSAWDGFRTTIGDMLSPIIREGVELLSSALSGLNSVMKKFPVEARLVTYALTGLVSARAVKRIWDIGSALVQLPVAWLRVHQAASAAQTAVEGTAAAAKIFGMSLHTALGVLGLIALASYEIYRHWDDITAAAKRAGEAISSIDTNKFSAAKSGTLSRSDSDYGVSVMSSTYMPPEIKNAEGGIYTRPIWTWAAEKGAEAIIPLTDRARGIPLVMRAAEILGLNPQNFTSSATTNAQKSINKNTSISSLSGYSLMNNRSDENSIIFSAREMNNHVSEFSTRNIDSNTAVGAGTVTFTPTYNITVSAESVSGIGENIRSVIEETMSEMVSRMERLSYA